MVKNAVDMLVRQSSLKLTHRSVQTVRSVAKSTAGPEFPPLELLSRSHLNGAAGHNKSQVVKEK